MCTPLTILFMMKARTFLTPGASRLGNLLLVLLFMMKARTFILFMMKARTVLLFILFQRLGNLLWTILLDQFSSRRPFSRRLAHLPILAHTLPILAHTHSIWGRTGPVPVKTAQDFELFRMAF